MNTTPGQERSKAVAICWPLCNKLVVLLQFLLDKVSGPLKLAVASPTY